MRLELGNQKREQHTTPLYGRAKASSPSHAVGFAAKECLLDQRPPQQMVALSQAAISTPLMQEGHSRLHFRAGVEFDVFDPCRLEDVLLKVLLQRLL